MSEDTEIMPIEDYLAKGGVLTSPANVPARYRGELLRLMAIFVDSELAGSAGFADTINTAPGITARIAACRITLEKADHAERLGRRGHIGIDHPHSVAEAISGCVLLSKGAKLGVDLDCRYLNIGNACGEALACYGDTGTCIEHACSASCRNRSGEEHRIAPCPVSAARLHDSEPTAEKAVGAGGGASATNLALLRRWHGRCRPR